MSFSNSRMSSEFSSELSSTVNSASLLPGNSESSAKDLKATWNKILLTWRHIHIIYKDGVVWLGPHLTMASTSTEEIPSCSVTLLRASALK